MAERGVDITKGVYADRMAGNVCRAPSAANVKGPGSRSSCRKHDTMNVQQLAVRKSHDHLHHRLPAHASLCDAGSIGSSARASQLCDVPLTHLLATSPAEGLHSTQCAAGTDV